MQLKSELNERRLLSKDYISSKLIILCLVTVHICVVLYFFGNSMFPVGNCDDAAIIFHYAANVGRGNGLTFNEGEHVEGYSSFLYTIILAIAYLIGFHNMVGVAAVFNLILSAGSVILTYMLIYELLEERFVSILGAVLVTLSGHFLAWTSSGLDTMLYAFLTLLAILLYVKLNSDYRDMLVFSFVLGLVCITRYESVLLLILVLAFEVKRAFTMKVNFVRFSAIFGIAGCMIFVWFLWKFSYYGYLMPHSVIFKRYFPYYVNRPRAVMKSLLHYRIIFLAAFGFFIPLPDKKVKKNSFILMFLFLWLIVNLAYIIFVAPYSDYIRYATHLIPIFAVFGTLGIHRFAKRMPFHGGYYITLAIYLFLAIKTFYPIIIGMGRIFDTAHGHQVARMNIGLWLKENTSPDAVVVCGNLGAVAYFSNRKIIDFHGLLSPDVLAHRKKNNHIQYILSKRPDYFVTASRNYKDPFQLPTVQSIYNTMRRDKSFQGKLQYETKQKGGGRDFWVFRWVYPQR